MQQSVNALGPPESSFAPGPTLLLGAPGVGKGTQAKLMMAKFAIPQISTGDLLRQHRQEQTTLGLMADDLMRRGILVPDDLVNDMVAARLTEADCVRGYILDGFPRTLAQADWLDRHLTDISQRMPVVAINVQVNDAVLLRRITGRRICPAGHIFNIYTQAPRVDGRCDVDGKPLEQRSDDSEQIFEQRMQTFHAQTAPVIEHYRAGGRFAEVDGSLSVSQVSQAIEGALANFRTDRLAQRGG